MYRSLSIDDQNCIDTNSDSGASVLSPGVCDPTVSILRHPETEKVSKSFSCSSALSTSLLPKIDYCVEENNLNNLRSDAISDQSEYWVQNLKLGYHEKALLEMRGSLTITTVDAASTLMHSEFSEFYGLDSVSRLSDCVGDGRLFIQIVPLKQSRTGQTTWAVLSNVFSVKDSVDLYDSSTRSYYVHEKREVRYHVSLEVFAAKILRTTSKQFQINVVKVTKVNKMAQTGVAAIFHALCLCRKLDPRRIHFQHQRLRRLLLESLENESFDNVSISSSPGPIPKALFEINVRLHCHCNMPYTKEPMAKCCVCDSWFHNRCEKGLFKEENWKCCNCSKNQEPSKSKRKRQKLHL